MGIEGLDGGMIELLVSIIVSCTEERKVSDRSVSDLYMDGNLTKGS